MVCFGAGTNMAFTIGLIYSFGVLLPVFMDYFKESRERTAWIGSLSVAFAFAAGPLAGSLINRFGCRVVSMTGCLTCALSLTVASFAKSLLILYVCYSFLGFGGGCVFLSSVVIVRKSFDKRQSIALGISSAGQGLGTMVLSQVIQSLVTAVRWRNTLRILAGSLFLNSLSGLLYDPKIETASTSEMVPSGEAGQTGQRPSSKRFTFHFSVWKVPGFLVLAASGPMIMFGRAANYVHLVKYSEDLGMSTEASARLVLFMGINIVIGRIACGFLCSIKWLSNWYVLQGVVLVMGVSMMLLTLAHSYEALVAYAFIYGFGDGGLATVFNIQAVTCVDQARAASAFGYLLLIASLSSLVGPPVTGLIADKGSYGPAFLVAGGLFIMGSLIPFVMLCVKTTERNGEESLNDETITGSVQELQERTNPDEVRITESVKRKRNSLSEECLLVSTV